MGNIIDVIIHPNLTVITDTPCYNNIKGVNDQLTYNTAGIHTNLDCGIAGYARLTLNPPTYANISIESRFAPINPGIQLVIPPRSIYIQITAINRVFNSAQTIYQDCITVVNALNMKLVAAVQDIFI